jgi:hypothetical protein
MKRMYCAVALAGVVGFGATAWAADAANGGPQMLASIPLTSEKPFDFDIGATSNGLYYLSDTSNSTLDVFDAKSMTLLDRIKADFTGIGATRDTSGPAGVVPIAGTTQVYVGDVNAVKVIDVASKQLVKTITVGSSGNRADQGCLDPVHHIAMFASGADTPPFVTFIDTGTQSIVAKLTMKDASGLGACAYDEKNGNFVLNNRGTPANPKGELNLIPVSTVLAGAPAVRGALKLQGCDGPSGIALGPGNDALIGCEARAGGRQTSLIVDRVNGTPLAEVPFGGVDEVVYDAVSNQYFLAAGNRSSNDAAQGDANAKDAQPAPALGIVNASTRSLVVVVPTGKDAHSVAADGQLHRVFVPYGAGSPAQYPGTGVAVFATE